MSLILKTGFWPQISISSYCRIRILADNWKLWDWELDLMGCFICFKHLIITSGHVGLFICKRQNSSFPSNGQVEFFLCIYKYPFIYKGHNLAFPMDISFKWRNRINRSLVMGQPHLGRQYDQQIGVKKRHTKTIS